MWFEILKFEILFRMKRLETYVFFFVLFVFSLIAFDFIFEGQSIGLSSQNSPYVIAKLMTVSTILVGLAPIFLSDGLGADVMRRIALPMIGGILTTLMLSLIVIPTVYYLWVGRELES